MASTAAGDEFDSWLIEKLRALNTDETVFSSYIKGILEGDETDEEKNDSLGEILSEITESQIASVREEILERWASVFRLKMREEAEAAQTKAVDVDEKLVRLLESQAKATVVVKNMSEEDRKLKEAILQQYGHVADPDFEDSEDDDEPSASQNQAQSLKCMEKNTNVDVVLQADKERREKARQDSVNKKEKDKEDREKQKQAQQDRKEKRKTQKGERRR